MGPVEELAAIRQSLGDLPERLARVLTRTERNEEGRTTTGGRAKGDKAADPMSSLRKFTAAGSGLPGGGIFKPFTDAIDTFNRIKEMFEGLAELRASLREQNTAKPPAPPPLPPASQRGFPAPLSAPMPKGSPQNPLTIPPGTTVPTTPTPATAPAPAATVPTPAPTPANPPTLPPPLAPNPQTWPTGATPLGPPSIGSPAAAKGSASVAPAPPAAPAPAPAAAPIAAPASGTPPTPAGVPAPISTPQAAPPPAPSTTPAGQTTTPPASVSPPLSEPPTAIPAAAPASSQPAVATAPPAPPAAETATDADTAPVAAPPPPEIPSAAPAPAPAAAAPAGAPPEPTITEPTRQQARPEPNQPPLLRHGPTRVVTEKQAALEAAKPSTSDEMPGGGYRKVKEAFAGESKTALDMDRPFPAGPPEAVIDPEEFEEPEGIDLERIEANAAAGPQTGNVNLKDAAGIDVEQVNAEAKERRAALAAGEQAKPIAWHGGKREATPKEAAAGPAGPRTGADWVPQPPNAAAPSSLPPTGPAMPVASEGPAGATGQGGSEQAKLTADLIAALKENTQARQAENQKPGTANDQGSGVAPSTPSSKSNPSGIGGQFTEGEVGGEAALAVL